MPCVDVIVRCPLYDSFRVQQVAGMFDVPLAAEQTERFTAEVPGLDEAWDIGLIVGPSGSGKSTIARRQWPAAYTTARGWPDDRAVLDGFSADSIKDITGTLTAVGFSSPPNWVKPYRVLSNGERFRCDLARAILEGGELVVFDEFTSVVDRTAARIGSAAVAKAIRRFGRRFVAISCHYDIAAWLQPDWVLDMASRQLARRRLQRPPIQLELYRTSPAAWRLFAKYHYLSGSLNRTAHCYLGVIGLPAGPRDCSSAGYGPPAGRQMTAAQPSARCCRSSALPAGGGFPGSWCVLIFRASAWAGPCSTPLPRCIRG